MATVRELITDALYSVAALGEGEALDDADADMCLRKLVRMVGLWANENLMVYAVTDGTLPTVAGTASYSTASLSSGRPVSIEAAFVRLSDGSDSPPLSEMTDNEYAQIGLKTSQGEPRAYRFLANFPNATLTFYPVPDAVYTIHVYGRYPFLATTITLDTSLSLPPGYEAALEANLSVAVASSFGVVCPDSVYEQARSSKAWLKRTNYRSRSLLVNLPYAPRTRDSIFEG